MTVLPEYTPKSAKFRQRVNDKCKDCTYDEFAPGTWRKQVENCTSVDCALHGVRPLTSLSSKQRGQL